VIAAVVVDLRADRPCDVRSDLFVRHVALQLAQVDRRPLVLQAEPPFRMTGELSVDAHGQRHAVQIVLDAFLPGADLDAFRSPIDVRGLAGPLEDELRGARRAGAEQPRLDVARLDRRPDEIRLRKELGRDNRVDLGPLAAPPQVAVPPLPGEPQLIPGPVADAHAHEAHRPLLHAHHHVDLRSRDHVAARQDVDAREEAAGVQPGDEVITVSHSYIATANAVHYCGATPVFVDIRPDTFNMDPRLIETAVTDRTRAILCVHQMGMPCDMQGILEVAGRHGLPVIEDAACAIGSEIQWDGQWEKIGRPHGDVACFSFHPRKVISTGDGGMITTAHAEWDAKFRLLRQHAMSVPDTVRHGSNQVIFESYPAIGYNYRMTDIQAAVGRVQLQRLPEIIVERREQAERYGGLLADISDLELPREPEWARSNWQSYCVRLPDACDQQAVMQAMLDAEISTRRGIMCSHREAAYADLENPNELRQSEAAQDHCVLLPLYPGLTAGEQAEVAQALGDAIRSATATSPVASSLV